MIEVASVTEKKMMPVMQLPRNRAERTVMAMDMYHSIIRLAFMKLGLNNDHNTENLNLIR